MNSHIDLFLQEIKEIRSGFNVSANQMSWLNAVSNVNR